MQTLPEALAPLAQYRQFILYKLVPDGAKTKKIPISPHTLRAFEKGANWQQNPADWVDAATALQILTYCGSEYGLGFIFQHEDPFFFVDLDDCALPDGSGWNQTAADLCTRFTGAAVEVSQSGRGLHIIGTATQFPPHGTDNKALKTQLYTGRRFVALTGTGAMGSAALDHTVALAQLVAEHYPQTTGGALSLDEWTEEPMVEWSGPEDDATLLQKALASRSAAAAFGQGPASFKELWEADADALARAYPDDHGNQARAYDASLADAALAQHLAFWTGKNCGRIQRLMEQSALAREKWEREDYLTRTILRAVGLQKDIYSEKPANTLAKDFGAPKLRGTEGQVKWAEQVRADKLAQCLGVVEHIEALCKPSGPTAQAKWWIECKDVGVEQLLAALKPVEHAADPLRVTAEPELLAGYQFLGVTQQLEHFAGCVYVQESHKIFTPSGLMLNQERFNATYGGYSFQLDTTGDGKTTRKAWEVFTESQAVRFPKAVAAVFRPEHAPGEILQEEGLTLVNTYVPIETTAIAGDPEPFLGLMRRLLPDERDRSILLTYMASLVQNPGRKFQWWPVLQGAEGNGKTLIVSSLSHAVGSRYTHCPNVDEIAKSGNKFNGWVRNRLFIAMEEVYVANRRDFLESFKTTVTNKRLPIENKGVDQVMGDNRANGLMCTNHREGVPVTTDTRRYCIFYTAQQTKADLARDGMDGGYFPDLYDWFEGRGKYEHLGRNYGFSVVNHFLRQYQVAEGFDPAGTCQRAPETSSTSDAVQESLGSVEQEILEAIDEGRVGFAGGWISSLHLDHLLKSIKADRAIPHNKRRALLQALGYDWHPVLKNGRVNNHVATDGGKPKLFIREGHLAAQLTNPADVVRRYEQDQQPLAFGGVAPAESIQNG